MDNIAKKKEFANTITHLVGVILFASMIPFLILRCFVAHQEKYLWSVLVFSFGLMMVYCFSTLYHFVKNENIKKKLRVMDHISIYFLIGGSYTPLVAKFVPNSLQFLLILWVSIAIGVVFKLFFTGKYDFVSTLSYLALGWMALLIIEPLYHNAPEKVLLQIIAGGVSYSTGVIFYVWKRYMYHHAIWHLFVLVGSFFHFLAIRASFA